MAKYRPKQSGRYKLGRNYNIRDPYRTLNLYLRLYNNPYRKPYKNPYRNKPPMRRGYKKSRSYTPSRKTHYRYPRQSTAPTYRPVPKQSTPRGNIRLPEPKHYKLPRIRVEPDAEQMLKQLEKRFDKKMQEQVLERLEAEIKELQEAFKEKSEAVEKPDTQEQEKIESALPEMAKQELESEEPNVEANDKTSAETKLYDAQSEIEEQTRAEAPAEAKLQETEEAELPTEDELYEMDGDLGEQIDETELTEASEEHEAIEPELEEPTLEPIETLESLTNQELIEQTAVDLLPPQNEPVASENPIDIEVEQLEDLEPLLDQIEPIEPELIEPIEIDGLPELLPEALEEEQEVIEGEAY